MEELRKLKSVAAVRGKPYVLRVVWKDGVADTVDMTGVLHRLKAFAPLRDPRAFRSVRVISEGLGIGWGNDLDYAARSLRILADQQRQLTGADLVAFERNAGLTTAETAQILDVAPRTIVSYRQSRQLPRSIASMLRMLRDDPAILAAHYRPIPGRPRGRPRKAAAAEAASPSRAITHR
jgi:DNA-binding CsgD family transcriptional regulator